MFQIRFCSKLSVHIGLIDASPLLSRSTFREVSIAAALAFIYYCQQLRLRYQCGHSSVSQWCIRPKYRISLCFWFLIMRYRVFIETKHPPGNERGNSPQHTDFGLSKPDLMFATWSWIPVSTYPKDFTMHAERNSLIQQYQQWMRCHNGP